MVEGIAPFGVPAGLPLQAASRRVSASIVTDNFMYLFNKADQSFLFVYGILFQEGRLFILAVWRKESVEQTEAPVLCLAHKYGGRWCLNRFQVKALQPKGRQAINCYPSACSHNFHRSRSWSASISLSVMGSPALTGLTTTAPSASPRGSSDCFLTTFERSISP